MSTDSTTDSNSASLWYESWVVNLIIYFMLIILILSIFVLIFVIINQKRVLEKDAKIIDIVKEAVVGDGNRGNGVVEEKSYYEVYTDKYWYLVKSTDAGFEIPFELSFPAKPRKYSELREVFGGLISVHGYIYKDELLKQNYIYFKLKEDVERSMTNPSEALRNVLSDFLPDGMDISTGELTYDSWEQSLFIQYALQDGENNLIMTVAVKDNIYGFVFETDAVSSIPHEDVEKIHNEFFYSSKF